MINSPVANVGSGRAGGRACSLYRVKRAGYHQSFFFWILWFYLLLELWCGGPQNNWPGPSWGPRFFFEAADLPSDGIHLPWQSAIECSVKSQMMDGKLIHSPGRLSIASGFGLTKNDSFARHNLTNVGSSGRSSLY